MATATLNTAAFKAGIKARLAPTAQKMQSIADAANGQIKMRFDTAGASGGVNWPQGIFPALAKTPPLAGMEDSFVPDGSYGVATVTCEGRWAAIHQQGCIGKGGILPDIVPTKASALFVPMTSLARESYHAHQQKAPRVDRVYSGTASLSVQKFSNASSITGQPLVYGVDYLLLQRVSIPPRPMLPTSNQERADLAAKTMKILANKAP